MKYLFAFWIFARFSLSSGTLVSRMGKPMTPEATFRTAFWVLFGGLLVIRAFFSLRVLQAGGRLMPDREAIEREGRGMFAVRLVAFFLLIALLVLYALNSPWIEAFSIPLPGWLRWAGFALGLASLTVWAWTQAALGTEWSPQLQLLEKHRLVTTGPYALVCHPLYMVMLGWWLSVALLTANWLFVLLEVMVIVGLLIRVPKEEKMMIEEFGEEYKKYMKRTGRLILKLH